MNLVYVEISLTIIAKPRKFLESNLAEAYAMTHDLYPKDIMLSREKMQYLLHLLMFILATTSEHPERDLAQLFESDDSWKRYPFDKDRVWNFLVRHLGRTKGWLMNGYGTTHLKEFLDWFNEETQYETIEIEILSGDVPCLQATYRDMISAMFCINTIAEVFAHKSIEFFDELLLTPTEHPPTNSDP